MMPKIPKTDSIQELADFWQRHDVTDFEDELEEVPGPVFQRAHVVEVPLPEGNMPDCFISYSSTDEELARFVEAHLRAQGLDVFLASVSLQPGGRWSEAIWANLKASPWVVFLASGAACRSAYAQQELGAAIAFDKRVIPIVWDLPPSELPGWLKERQALDLRGGSWDDLALAVQNIAAGIMADKRKGALVAGAVVFGLIWLASRDK